MDHEKRIIFVSDGTGETAAQMTKAALVQFPDRKVSFTRYKKVSQVAQIEAICEDAAVRKDLIIFTIVTQELKECLLRSMTEKQIPFVDLLGPLMDGLASHFGYQPTLVAGILHGVNESYYRRIEAMEYTIAHDDGRELKGLEDADIVILGISRTSKTPLSMYLSHQGWKVANIPLIKGFSLPEELKNVDQRKIVGLTIDSDHLASIRRARLSRLGQDKGGEYADLEKIQEEIDYASEIFRKNRRWPVFDVTGKALEETASEIMKLMSSRKLVPRHTIENMVSTR